ncbi:protein partner of snf isoform X1 [Megalopta genalis]|uniref:protein partner of snf isoform X1 n=1 Tax=Megalopta genalis TaxID=115081 RepID=UPI003FD49852
MSSSYVVEPQESGSEKKDDTLIIVVNDDGTISVDQETLQSLITNQSNANVSVVRLGQAETDTENGDITLTVDPPPFVAANVNSGGTTTDATSLVDPFMEMDPEQLERLETALQSEEAKQILGENVTAMLDMLTVEEQQNSIRYSVELDHCYTSRLSPSDPKPRDPLPTTDSPTPSDSLQYEHQLSPNQGTSSALPSVGDGDGAATTTAIAKTKTITKTTKPVGRPRKNVPPTSVATCNNSRPSPSITSTPKSIGHSSTRSLTGTLHQGLGRQQGRLNDEEEEEPTSSSIESSESEPPSDNDSDFGPRGPRRGGIRARGGRKGLTTRGGSMAATRRRGTNKQMDMEQVRRLDMEMAAAVNAMKSPEKEERSGFSLVRGKRQFKTTIGRKKEDTQRVESSTVTVNENTSPSFEKPLQTTNQVKANLISANMIKGDMILTKPGQGKNNQKVTFVQKQVLVKSNDMKSVEPKKQLIFPKGKFVSQTGTKIFATKDGKLVQVPMPGKTVTSTIPVTQIKGTVPQVSSTQQMIVNQNQTLHTQQQQSVKVSTPASISKVKSCDVKKEKRKSDSFEMISKPEIEPGKATEIKILDDFILGTKKHPKKESRKSPAYMVDSLGPALFSTPDIIRRVGSNGDVKIQENIVTSLISVTPVTSTTTTGNANSVASTTPASSSSSSSSPTSTRTGVAVSTPIEQITQLESHPSTEKRENDDTPIESNEDEAKPDPKTNGSEEIQPPLDTGSMDGEEHLLATLEMEANKHEEELLAEALMLQEELGVDLTEHGTTLVEQGGGGGTTSESLPLNSTLVPPVLVSDQEAAKPLDTLTTAVVASLASTTAATVSAAVVSATRESAKKPAKDEKEPIQIIRGGRVITLPPIEAPATRSKRLQAKVEPAQKLLESMKSTDKFSLQTVPQRSLQILKNETPTNVIDQDEEIENEDLMEEDDEEVVEEEEMDQFAGDEEEEEDEEQKQIGAVGEDEEEAEEEEDEEEEEEEEDNSDSEDDPDRLWCICKRPHNNRFMICCDVCEDWFHGKCVHVSKAMGQQMEEKGIEWVCPNCLKKKDEDAKTKGPATIGKQRVQLDNPIALKNLAAPNQASVGGETTPTNPSSSDYGDVQYSGNSSSSSSSMQCVVCKKEARNSSIYCSDACILAHAQETLTKDKPSSTASTISPKGITRPLPLEISTKSKSDSRVIVFERKTGKVLSGIDAPTRSNLRTWLKENPTFEVVGANNLGPLQIGKAIATIHTQIPGKTGKSTLLTTGKGPNLPKMTYTKVPGSKQMIITTGNKKFTVISTGQQHIQTANTKPIQLKQTVLAQANKSPFVLKTTTIKSSTPIQVKQLQSVPTLKQIQPVKRQEVKQPVVQSKQQLKPTPPKKPETEPIRLNIRKTLTELLSSRIKETEDLKLNDDEIADLAFNIELEMYKYFKDTGAKYKAKYRSLVFNIKDTKNLTLFRKIANRSLTPDAVVRLSPDEMASQELAEWREKETKHQLEMIKKNELDLMAQAKSIVVKTHKGEQIIENDGGIDHVDPKTPVQDIVTALNSADSITSTVDDPEKELERINEEERLRIKEDAKKSKFFDEKKKKEKERSREKDKVKDKERSRERDNSRSKAVGRRERSTSTGRHKHGRDDRERSKTREKSRERKSREKESKREKERDREKEKDRDRDRSRTRDRDRIKLREKGSKERSKQKDKEKERGERERHRSGVGVGDGAGAGGGIGGGGVGGGSDNNLKSRSVAGGFVYCESKELDKREDEKKRDTEKKDDSIGLAGGSSTERSIEDRLWRHIEDEATTNTIDGNDSDVSDREPTSTVTIKTPDINEDVDRDREQESLSSTVDRDASKGSWQTVWRGFVNMVDVAKFFITAQEVSGHAKDLMDDLPDTVDVVGRISHDTVWDYISKMKKTGSKEILVIRLTAANDEEKIPYITLYSYLNSRSRLGVVGNVSKNIKDFYIMPFSSQSTIPQVLLPLNGPGFEEHRPHLLLGIIVRNKRKRFVGVSSSTIPIKLAKKDSDRSYTPPLVSVSKDKVGSSNVSAMIAGTVTITATATSTVVAAVSSPIVATAGSIYQKATIASAKEKQQPQQQQQQHTVTQTTLDTLNKAHIGMPRSTILDTATICKIVPELSSKIDLTSSPGKVPIDDDGDEPYSPGQMDEEQSDRDLRTTSTICTTAAALPSIQSVATMIGIDGSAIDNGIISSSKNSNELQRKMEELNRQIEEQKQQIQSISSSFLGESTSTLPGLGLDPPISDECEEAYSPPDTRSFTPPPPPISKFAQPILDKVSNITIPPNLQEILANVKRQESTKVDPYLPSKPSATFLTTVNSAVYQNTEKYSSASPTKISIGGSNKSSTDNKPSLESISHKESVSKEKESKSTLSSLSDLDLIKKAEEELAAVAAAASASAAVTATANTTIPGSQAAEHTAQPVLSATSTLPTMIGNSNSSMMPLSTSLSTGLTPVGDPSRDTTVYKSPYPESFKRNLAPEQPKPPGLEDEDFPPFPSTPPSVESNAARMTPSRSKFVPKSGIVLSVKRKMNDDSVASSCGSTKASRIKSRWGQGPSDSGD